MASYANLKAAIQQVIRTNGNQEITGALLQQSLLAMINSLGGYYQFVGIATPETNPGTPDQQVFYIGSAGTYPNFGPSVVPDGNMGIFYYDTDWHFGTVAFPIGSGTITETNLAASLVNKLFSTGYKFAGIATPSTTPGIPDQNVFYIGGPGTYQNFGETHVVNEGLLGFFKYNNSWTFETVQVGETNTVKYVSQILTESQKQQARENIGAADDEQLRQARGQIDKNTEDIFEMFATYIVNSSYTEQVGWLINSTNVWQKVTGTQASNYGCILIPITPGMRYRVYGNTTGTIIAVLASNSMVANASPDFCTEYNGRIGIAIGGVYDFIAPEDAEYLYLLLKSSGSTKDGYVKYSPVEIPKIEKEIQDVKVEVAIINSDRMDISGLTPIDDLYIASTGKWTSASSGLQQFILVPIVPGTEYVINGGTTGGIYAILASDSMTVGTTADFCVDYPKRGFVESGKAFVFTAPEDAAFAYITTKSSGADKDMYIAAEKPISQTIDELRNEIEEGPGKFQTAPEYYTWLKSEQFTNIKWTPKKATIQKASATTKFPANTEQQGIPYSSVWERAKFVGFNVSLHTFMTALNNPYSLMYTECVRYGYSQSAYGISYWGAQNSGPYYGVVCSGYAGYSLGIPVPYATFQFAGLSEMEEVYDQSANGLQLGDIIWQSGHTRIVKEVWRKNGITTKVHLAEAVQPLTKDDAIMTATEFNTLLASINGIIYRYKDMYKNIKYTPSPYVAVGDETPQTITYNNDICTFAGDKATFAEGDLIYIHCLNLAYPQMEIYKDNVLVETITLATDPRATKTSDNLAYAVNLSNDNLSYGKYKCRLKNGGTFSDYTYFEVLDVNLSVSGNTASYFSANAVAVYMYYRQYNNTAGSGPNGNAPIDGQASGTIDITDAPVSTHPALMVIFRGDYGTAFAQVVLS